MIKENQSLTFSKNKTSPTSTTADVNISLENMGIAALKEVFQTILKQITESNDMSAKEKIVALNENGIVFLLELVLFCGIVRRI